MEGFMRSVLKVKEERWLKWLNEQGITALVLKYRLVPTGEDGVAEISELSEKNPAKIGEEVGKGDSLFDC